MPATPARRSKGTKMNATDYRIEEIQSATVNGKSVLLFKAFRKTGDAYVFCGQFSAPPKTAKRDLWQVADDFVERGLLNSFAG